MSAGAGYFNSMPGFRVAGLPIKPPSDPKAWRKHFGVLAEMGDEPPCIGRQPSNHGECAVAAIDRIDFGIAIAKLDAALEKLREL